MFQGHIQLQEMQQQQATALQSGHILAQVHFCEFLVRGLRRGWGSPPPGQKISKSKTPNKIEYLFSSDLHLPANFPGGAGGGGSPLAEKVQNP